MASDNPELCDNAPVLLIAHLGGAGKRGTRVQDAPTVSLGFAAPAFSTMPPATPTPSTYIHPSWKSKMCELNSEVKMFCTTTNNPIQLASPSPRNRRRCESHIA